MKKYILGIFICLLPIFLMSHNASAIDLTYDVEHVYGGFESTFRGTATSWVSPACISPVNVKLWTCSGGNLTSMYITIPNRQYVDGDWITIQFSSNLGRNNTANHSQFLGFKYGGNHPIDVMQLKVEQFSDNSQFATLYLRVHGTFTDSNLYFDGGASTGSPIVQLYGNGENSPGITLLTTNVYHETAGKDYTSTLNSINNNLNSTNNKLDTINDTLEQQQQDEQDALDDATQDAQDGADDSSQDAANATTGLISVISGFVSAVTSASPSDCKINGNMGHLNIGNIDLCSLPAPSFVQIIGSIILILVCIPFVIIMFNRFISLFRSFQG